MWTARVAALLVGGCCGLAPAWVVAGCGSSDEPAADAGVAGDGGRDGAPGEPDASSDPDAGSPPIRIDGVFDDWGDAEPIVVDPAGDATGAFDLTRVYAQSRGTELFLRFDVGPRLNLQFGAEAQGTLQLELGLPSGETLTIDHRAREVTIGGRHPAFQEVAYESAPTHSSVEFEAHLDLSSVGVALGDRITIDYAGSDSLPEPADLVLETPAPAPVRRSTERTEPTTVRIASLNIHDSGFSTDRRAALVRLLASAQADIYCIQEELDLTSDELQSVFEEVRDVGAPWSFERVYDNVIASIYPLRSIPVMEEFYAAAEVDLGEAGSLMIVGVHLKCCGYDGSEEDTMRVNEALGIVRTIESDPIYGQAPVVAMGDFNLVGSREPLDVLEEPDRLALTQWLLPQLIGEHAMTYYSRSSDIPPGIIDLVLYSQQGLVPQNGFILEEPPLSDDERTLLGLDPGDDEASDHRMLVADFEIGP